MKKSICTLVLVFVMFVLGACVSSEFNGSRTGNAEQLIMEYQVLNKRDFQILELSAGDYVDFMVASESGKIDILLQREGEEPLYNGVDVPTGSFEIMIEETGSYTVSVTGEKARGSVSIVKRELIQK